MLNGHLIAAALARWLALQRRVAAVVPLSPRLFEDPDGIRLEANFVPGAGVLAPGVKFNPSEGYQS
jgi:hypothetical protein